MTAPNAEEKRKQLALLYADMTAFELQELAEQAYALTEAGKDALRLELTHRGLKIELRESTESKDDAMSSNLVTVQRFRNSPEAVVAKSILESAGVECYFGDDITIRMDWLLSNALGGIKLRVGAKDFEAAAELLNQARPESFEVDGVGEYDQPRCPKCQSLDISFNELNKPVAYPSLLLGLPLPFERTGWLCHSCGYIWAATDDAAN